MYVYNPGAYTHVQNIIDGVGKNSQPFLGEGGGGELYGVRIYFYPLRRSHFVLVNEKRVEYVWYIYFHLNNSREAQIISRSKFDTT